MALSTDAKTILAENFSKCIQGHHLLYNTPVKESIWEEVEEMILTCSGYTVSDMANGGHASGADKSCEGLGKLSDKTGKYEGSNSKVLKISSYRMTTVCGPGHDGTQEEICAEIGKRKNFDYYSIAARSDVAGGYVYDWYLFPSTMAAFDPATYAWTPTTGQRGKNKSNVNGWKTNVVDGSSMSISYAASSQLWMSLAMTAEVKSHLIASQKVTIGRTMTLVDLFNAHTRTSAPPTPSSPPDAPVPSE
jgi:hypothetical protein